MSRTNCACLAHGYGILRASCLAAPLHGSRNRFKMKKISLLLLLLLALCSSAVASGPDPKPWGVASWALQTSLYTVHFDPEDDHNNHQKLIAAEAYFNNGWVAGAAHFKNSFDQSSQYVFIGKIWPILDSEHWYFKLTGGLLNGYDEPHEHKIPLNDLGVAPAILPSLGFRTQRILVEANLGGISALTITAGIRF